MEERGPLRQIPVDRVLVRKIFSLVCHTLGLRPDFDADFGDNSNASFVRISESIIAIQIMLRDFLKRLFTSRSREIAFDLTAATHNIIDSIDGSWDGLETDKVYTMSAVLIELYLYCDSMQLSVPGEFFTDMFFNTNLADSFGLCIVLRGEELHEKPPASTFWLDYRELSEYIFRLTAPYQSVPVQSIPTVLQNYNMLVQSMSKIFPFSSIISIRNCSSVSKVNIQEATTNLAMEDFPEGSQEAPSLRAEGGSVDGHSTFPPSTEMKSLKKTHKREDPSIKRKRQRRIKDSYSVKEDGSSGVDDAPSKGIDVPSTSSGHSEVAPFKGDSVRPQERHRTVLDDEDSTGDSSVRPKERHRTVLGDEDHTSVEEVNRSPTAKDRRRRVTFGGTSVILIDCRSGVTASKRPPTGTKYPSSGSTASKDLPVGTGDSLPGTIPTEGLATRIHDQLCDVTTSKSLPTRTEYRNRGVTAFKIPTKTQDRNSGATESKSLLTGTKDRHSVFTASEGLQTRIYDYLCSVAAAKRLSTGTKDHNHGATVSEGFSTRTKDLCRASTTSEDPRGGSSSSDGLTTGTEDLHSSATASKDLSTRTEDSKHGVTPSQTEEIHSSVTASESFQSETEDSRHGVTAPESLPTRTEDIRSGFTDLEDPSTTESEHPTTIAKEDEEDSSNDK